MRWWKTPFLFVLFFALACGDDAVETDAGVDGGAVDAGVDGGPIDDGGPSDGGPLDSGPDEPDAGPVDAGADDAGPADAGFCEGYDAGMMDAGQDISCGLSIIWPPFDACPTEPHPANTIPGMTSDPATATDVHDPSGDLCPTVLDSGLERVYYIQPGITGRYRVTLTPLEASYDAVLYLLASCESTECLAGANDNGPGEAEVVEIDMVAGEIALVVADTETGADGTGVGGGLTLTTEMVTE